MQATQSLEKSDDTRPKTLLRGETKLEKRKMKQ